MHSLFTVKQLQNLHLGISTVSKECVVSYLPSDSMLTHMLQKRLEIKPLLKIRDVVLRGCDLVLSAFQRESRTPIAEVDFSKGDVSSELNWLLLNVGVRWRLEGKSFDAVDMVFPFVVGFIDQTTGYAQSALITRVITMYTELVNILTRD